MYSAVMKTLRSRYNRKRKTWMLHWNYYRKECSILNLHRMHFNRFKNKTWKASNMQKHNLLLLRMMYLQN